MPYTGAIATGIGHRRAGAIVENFYYTYVLLSKTDNHFYIGFTNDLDRRLCEHQQGKNISTSKRLPVELLYFEGHRSKEDALRREMYFKTAKGKTTLKQILRKSLTDHNMGRL
jgi:putative endonuclease